MKLNQESPVVSLGWLNQAPRVLSGVTWGVPWDEGVLMRDEPLSLADESGQDVPIQSWPTAYWPDGSVKWTAHTAVLSPSSAKQRPIGGVGSADDLRRRAAGSVDETELSKGFPHKPRDHRYDRRAPNGILCDRWLRVCKIERAV